MFYRSEFDVAKTGSHYKEFSPFRSVYRLNSSTDVLEYVEEEDVNDAITSCLDEAQDAIIERLVPSCCDEVTESFATQDSIDLLTHAGEVAAEWRERLHLPDTMTIGDVLKQIGAYRDSLFNKDIKDNKGGTENVQEKKVESEEVSQVKENPQEVK